ncbi:MAG: hypothetical protein PHC43_00015 [Candidatus Marinimicrobia bacterium]|jgi:hypothetical protein|nr:hypothetical protein [Candidatus Neomarinimicrobiota bacterium]
MLSGDEKTTIMMASLGMEDMNIPELKINQATGGDYAKENLNAKLGQMYVSTTGDVHDKINVQVLMVQKNQTFWGRDDITDEPPICSSLDGIMSVDGQICKECQHYRARPSLDKDERRKECQAGYVVLALDENQMPLVIRLMGISADSGRDLNAMLYFNKGLRNNRGSFYFQITTLKKKTASGEAWMFKFLLVKDKFPSEEQISDYLKVARDLKVGSIAKPEETLELPHEETKSIDPPGINIDTHSKPAQTIDQTLEDSLKDLDIDIPF